MRKKDRRKDGGDMFMFGTSAPDKLKLFFQILGSKATIVTIICLTLLIGLYIVLNKNPTGASLVTVINGNGNGDNNSGNNYSDHSPAPSERPQESDPSTKGDLPIENDSPAEPEQTDKCDGIRYRVVHCEGLRLRKNPSTASDILKLLPCYSEVISEGCADERGWMPVRVELPCGNYLHGYVFAAYVDPIS